MTDKPLNYQGPTKEETLKRVAEFLETPVLGEIDGWTEVTSAHMAAVDKVFQSILDSKFERDIEYEHTIGYSLVDRSKARMVTTYIPNEETTFRSVHMRLEAAYGMASTADHILRSAELDLKNLMRKAAREDQMKQVLHFCAVNGHTELYSRLYAFTEDPESLFIGTDDSVWEPLGLTCYCLRNVVENSMNDREERNSLTALISDSTKRMGEQT